MNEMNNILLDNIILNNDNLDIDNKIISKITANGISNINLFNCNIINLDIEVKDNSALIINSFLNVHKLKTNINIKTNNKSRIVFNHSFHNSDDYKLNIITDFLDNESSITVNIKGLNDGGKCEIDVSGYVKENKIDNVLDENLSIININNGISISNPNMYIDTSKVIANHNTTIGGIREEELFYLMSKGLNKENASKLICNGFLISIIDSDTLKEKIKDIL